MRMHIMMARNQLSATLLAGREDVDKSSRCLTDESFTSTMRVQSWIKSTVHRAFIPLEDYYPSYKEGYVFGYAARGIGYYSLQTKIAYKILIQRADERIRDNRNDIRDMAIGCGLILFIPCLIPAMCWKVKQNKELKDLKIAWEARLQAAGPEVELKLPKASEEHWWKKRLSKGSDFVMTRYDQRHSGNRMGGYVTTHRGRGAISGGNDGWKYTASSDGGYIGNSIDCDSGGCGGGCD